MAIRYWGIKDKLLELVSGLKSESVNKQEQFDVLFRKVYGFDLTYEKINELWIWEG